MVERISCPPFTFGYILGFSAKLKRGGETKKRKSREEMKAKGRYGLDHFFVLDNPGIPCARRACQLHGRSCFRQQWTRVFGGKLKRRNPKSRARMESHQHTSSPAAHRNKPCASAGNWPGTKKTSSALKEMERASERASACKSR